MAGAQRGRGLHGCSAVRDWRRQQYGSRVQWGQRAPPVPLVIGSDWENAVWAGRAINKRMGLAKQEQTVQGAATARGAWGVEGRTRVGGWRDRGGRGGGGHAETQHVGV